MVAFCERASPPDENEFCDLCKAHRGFLIRDTVSKAVFLYDAAVPQTLGVAPNAYTYNAAISACGKAGRYAQAVALLRQMSTVGIAPDQVGGAPRYSSPLALRVCVYICVCVRAVLRKSYTPLLHVLASNELLEAFFRDRGDGDRMGMTCWCPFYHQAKYQVQIYSNPGAF